MLPVGLVYLGAAIALLGVLAVAHPIAALGLRTRARGLGVLLAGVALATTGLALPAPYVLARAPHGGRLDEVMPRYQFVERHVTRVAAAPAAVDRALREVTADDIRSYRTLTWIGRGGRRGPQGLLDAPRGEPILAVATRTGFRVVVDDPGREVILGVAGPVSAEARAHARPGASRPFVAEADGYASIVLDFHITADGRGGSVVSTETRVNAPDADTRRRFARYWRVIYPGSALIRRSWLAAVRRRAEAASRRDHVLDG